MLEGGGGARFATLNGRRGPALAPELLLIPRARCTPYHQGRTDVEIPAGEPADNASGSGPLRGLRAGGRSTLGFPAPGQAALLHCERGRGGDEQGSPGIFISEWSAVTTDVQVETVQNKRNPVTPSVHSFRATLSGAPGEPRATHLLQRTRRSSASRYSCTAPPRVR